MCQTALCQKDNKITVQNGLGDTLWYYVVDYYSDATYSDATLILQGKSSNPWRIMNQQHYLHACKFIAVGVIQSGQTVSFTVISNDQISDDQILYISRFANQNVKDLEEKNALKIYANNPGEYK